MNKEILQKIKQEYTRLGSPSKTDSYTDAFYKGSDTVEGIIKKYGSGSIKQTNNLWVWLSDMTVNDYEETFGITLDKDNKNRQISVYVDIENSNRMVAVPFEQQADFEYSSTVVRGKQTISNPYDRYSDVRREFFLLCINEGQEQAVKTLLEKEKTRIKEEIERNRQKRENSDESLTYDLIIKKSPEKKNQKVLAKKYR